MSAVGRGGVAADGGRGGGGAERRLAQRPHWRKPHSSAKYPPTTPMIVGGIEEIRTDDAANEIYIADNAFGGRVMVFSLDKFEFKRGWGAYGHKLSRNQHQARRPRLQAERSHGQGVRRPPDL